MFLDSKLKKEIIEAKYLSVENTWRYRAIIRIMFKNYEKMNFWMLKEQIYEELIKLWYRKLKAGFRNSSELEKSHHHVWYEKDENTRGI